LPGTASLEDVYEFGWRFSQQRDFIHVSMRSGFELVSDLFFDTQQQHRIVLVHRNYPMTTPEGPIHVTINTY